MGHSGTCSPGSKARGTCLCTHSCSHIVSLQAWPFEDLRVHIPLIRAVPHTMGRSKTCSSQARNCRAHAETLGCIRVRQPLGKPPQPWQRKPRDRQRHTCNVIRWRGFPERACGCKCCQKRRGVRNGVLLLNCVSGASFFPFPGEKWDCRRQVLTLARLPFLEETLTVADSSAQTGPGGMGRVETPHVRGVVVGIG